MVNRWQRFEYAFLLVVVLAGCGAADNPNETFPGADGRQPVVATTSYPLYKMASELAGDDVVVEYSVAAGQTSRTWVPSSEDVQKLQAADVVLLNGAGYEPWTLKLSLPRSRTIDTSNSYRDRLIQVENTVTHQHGPVGQQSDRGVISTIWLDPELAAAQLRRVEEQLLRLAPEAADAISQRATAFSNTFDQLDQQLQQLVADSAGNTITVFTNETDLQYLITRLGWQSHQIQWSEAGRLTEETVNDINTTSPQLILIHADCNENRVQVLQATGITCVVVDTCESELSGADSLVARMSGNLDRLRAGLGR
ncbi:MAG: zinc ABC transporter substrate-binding protein [Fuerstiella sp.]|nr:zinc ABC transporter substrate-binding protein [Fuerstiella sp.]